jgi:hypothetical protein
VGPGEEADPRTPMALRGFLSSSPGLAVEKQDITKKKTKRLDTHKRKEKT